MMITFKITADQLATIRNDLQRRHPFAHERVGFISCRPAMAGSGLMILVHGYHPVADEDYLNTPNVGATMGPTAIRKALQLAYISDLSMFHVHLHHHRGRTEFSQIDISESKRFVPDFFNVRPDLPHGALVVSLNSATGLCWMPNNGGIKRIDHFVEVGRPMRWFGTIADRAMQAMKALVAK